MTKTTKIPGWEICRGNYGANKDTTMEAAGLGFSEFLTGILSIAFGAWSLALNGARKDLKEIRAEFSAGMSGLTKEIARLREELTHLGNRVTKVEVQQQHYHPEYK